MGGMERENINTDFLYKEGTYVEAGTCVNEPSSITIVVGGERLTLDDYVPRLFISSGAVKTQLSKFVDVGMSYTTVGNGTKVEGAGDDGAIILEILIPTLTGIIKYNLNENMSILGGIKHITINKGLLLQSSTRRVVESNKSETGFVYGTSYQNEDIRLRAEIFIEKSITISDIPLNVQEVLDGGGLGEVEEGLLKIGIGDAITLKFQSEIMADTLLYGSIRNSKWKDSQMAVDATDFTIFGDSKSYTLGTQCIINEKVSVSITLVNDDPDIKWIRGVDENNAQFRDVGHLSFFPIASSRTNSVTIGSEIRINDSIGLSIAGTYTHISDTTVSDGIVTSLTNPISFKAKINYTF